LNKCLCEECSGDCICDVCPISGGCSEMFHCDEEEDNEENEEC